MVSRGYKSNLPNKSSGKSRALANTDFPESHAASFALLVYVSAWLKCHEPAAFLCAMLNSLPMGFYSASQLIQDARRHGVQIRPVDVTISDWECTLEEQTDEPSQSIASTAPALSMSPAVRLGLNRVKGMGREAAKRIMEARKTSPFENTDDLASRASIECYGNSRPRQLGCITRLVRPPAPDAMGGRIPHQAAGHDAGVPVKEALPVITAAPEGEEILSDYASTGLTLRRHPLALLRPKLARMNLRSAMELDSCPPGRLVRTTGIVTCRQRPGTANGVMFVTLEDETGIINVILWNQLILKHRREALGARLLTVYGVWQSESGVKHVIAKRLVDHSHLLGNLAVASRDFH